MAKVCEIRSDGSFDFDTYIDPNTGKYAREYKSTYIEDGFEYIWYSESRQADDEINQPKTLWKKLRKDDEDPKVKRQTVQDVLKEFKK